ncbi:tRNA1(Val) (adenine(37)-N6)-methyltransferase [Thermovibrio ammonificans]
MEAKYDLSTFLDNRCRFYQRTDGFRFGTDTFLLTDFVKLKGKERLADLGTGCGVIPILLLLKHPKVEAVGIDVLEENVKLALKNAELNKVAERFQAVTLNVTQVREHFRPSSFDVVVSNPPFIEVGRGSTSTRSMHRAVARQELKAKLEDFIKAASYLLKDRGRFFLLLPTVRFTDAVELLRANRLEPKRLRFIYPEPSAQANLFLLESVKGGGKGVVVEPPLVVYKDAKVRKYTEEVAAKYRDFLKSG